MFSIKPILECSRHRFKVTHADLAVLIHPGEQLSTTDALGSISLDVRC
jgi:hypothetical protein